MAQILIDVNVLLDAFLGRNEESSLLIDRLVDTGHELFIAASMLPVLDYFLSKYRADKQAFKAKFFEKFKVVATTGFDVLQSFDFADGEDALAALSFRRIARDGIIITSDRDFPQVGLTVMTPREALESSLLFEENNDSRVPLLDLKREYCSLIAEIDQAVLEAVASAQYILGPQVRELEEKVASYLGVKHCVGVASGTDALLLSLRALAIKRKGQEYFDRSDLIITTPFTFTATGDTILRAGATPLFVDIDPVTFNINPEEVRKALEAFPGKVVGIVPVHLFGLPCDMDAIMEIARAYNLFVVEDVAQAFGASWKGQKLGSIGDAGAFSFFPTKNLGCFGDGGMVATNNGELAELVRSLRVHGGRDKYNVNHIGYKARLDTLQAAILLVKLKYVDEWNRLRQDIARAYNRNLANAPGLVLPPSPEDLIAQGITHVYHQYTVKVKGNKRDALREYLKSQGVEAMVYYPVPLHQMRVFSGRCVAFGNLREAEQVAREVLSLPIEPLMKAYEIERVTTVIREGMEKLRA